MGADLYIKKMPREPQYTGFRSDVSVGYFRESYGRTSVLGAMGLSYWQIAIEWNVEEDLSVEQVKKLIDLIKKRKHILDKYVSKLINEDEKHYYIETYKDLVTFLEKAIELDSPVIFSV